MHWRAFIFSKTLLAFSLALVACISHAAENILVLNNTNDAPYTTAAGDGYLDIIAREAFRRCGLSLQLVKQPPERGLLNANSGQLDGDLTRIKGIEKLYPDLVMVPEKLIDWEFVAFANKPAMVTNWETIYASPVGHIIGWKIFEQMLQGAPAVTVAQDAEQLFTLLSLKRVNVILYEKWLGLAMAKQLGLNNMSHNMLPLQKREMFIYLHKRHQQYVPRLANALREMKQQGFYTQVYQTHLKPFINTD